MKTLFRTLVVLLLFGWGYTQGLAQNVLQTNDFEAGVGIALPGGWTNLNITGSGTAHNWQTQRGAGIGHNSAAALRSNTHAATVSRTLLLMPAFDVPDDGTDYQLIFFSRHFGSGGGTGLNRYGEGDSLFNRVWATTNLNPTAANFNAGTDFTEIKVIPVNNTVHNQWFEIRVSLAAFAGQRIRIVFDRFSPQAGWNWFIDDVEISRVPTGPFFVAEPRGATETVFNNAPTPRPITFRVTNPRGLSDLEITGAVSGNPDRLAIASDQFPLTVEPNDTAYITVDLTSLGLPTGTFNGTFQLQTNDPNIPTATLPLTATVAVAPVGEAFQQSFTATVMPPVGWNEIAIAGISPWTRNTAVANLLRDGAVARIHGNQVEQRRYLVTSAVKIPETGVFEFEFYSRVDNVAGMTVNDVTRPFHVRISTTGPGGGAIFDTARFDRIIKTLAPNTPEVPNPSEWTRIIIPMDDFAGQVVNFAFEYHIAQILLLTASPAWNIDEVRIVGLPTTQTFEGLDTIGFGTVHGNIYLLHTRTYNIINRTSGTENLIVSGFSDASPQLTIVGDFPITIAPGETQSITVTLDPRGLENGPFVANFTLATNDPENPTVIVYTAATVATMPIANLIDNDFNTAGIPATWSQGQTITGGQNFAHSGTTQFWGVDNTRCLHVHIVPDQRRWIRTGFVEMGNQPMLSFQYLATNAVGTGPAVPIANDMLIYTVRITRDFGQTWTEIRQGNHIESANFRRLDINVEEFAGDTVMVEIGFESAIQEAGVQTRVFLDNVVVGTLPLNSLATSGTLTQTPTGVGQQIGTEMRHTLSIVNRGLTTQNADTYSVRLMCQRQGLIATLPGVTIAQGELRRFEFVWTPTLGTNLSLYGVVDFPGNQSTDTMTPTFGLNANHQDISHFIADTVGMPIVEANLPLDFRANTGRNLSQTIIHASEIGMNGGVITGLVFRTVNAGAGIPVTVWIGETDKDDLYDGWIDPSTLTQVFYGNFAMNAAGQHTLAFQLAHRYQGGNIVVLMYKRETATRAATFWNVELESRSRMLTSPDPMNVLELELTPNVGTVMDYRPFVYVNISTTGMGSLSGLVSDASGPIEDAEISLYGTIFTAVTGADGMFSFPFLAPGEYTIVAEARGHTERQVVVTVDGATTQNIFFVPTYVVTITPPTGGTITVTRDDNISVSSGDVIDVNTELMLTATPTLGYAFEQWWDGYTEPTRTITLISDTTISATFVEVPLEMFTVTITTPTNGTITVMDGSDAVTSGDEIEEGTELTLTAVPAEGFLFNQWWDGNTTLTRTITLLSDTTISATFTEIPPTLFTVTITAPINGTITVMDGNETVVSGDEIEEGTELTLTATPAEGYEFSQWWDENTALTRTITLTSDTTISGTFVISTAIQLPSNETTLSVYPNPVSDILHIQTDEVIREIVVLDMFGRTLIRQQGNQRSINLQSIPAGNYVVRIHTETAIIPIQIIKQ